VPLRGAHSRIIPVVISIFFFKEEQEEQEKEEWKKSLCDGEKCAFRFPRTKRIGCGTAEPRP
jgi:hypothetical protein